ncbi:glycoside hydrolase family 16 protein [Pseudonocardia hispaniensis]|uniref:Glycoside hydrolase family 16 protein n=1 Tax=Pseudonocardia hispaniensis TaxID=904933 RepID=A0ABW1J8M1_9PSEU
MSCSRLPATVGVLLAAVLALTGCRVTGGSTQVDTGDGCTEITMPSIDVSAPSAPATLPGVVLAPCPTTPPPAPTTELPAPTTAPTTTSPPATTPPPAGDPTSAAVQRGWGTPVGGDEFDYVGAPDPAKWYPYDGPGHAGNGIRTPDAFSVNGEVLRVHGDATGRTGGMEYTSGQYLGRWEARMKAPAGDGAYHPMLLLWPDAEDFPVGGEIDYAEIFRGDRQSVNFFLHYGADNSQTYTQNHPVDATAWHNYAVEWATECVTGWIDNVQWFQDCNPDHIPPRSMHPTIQLDGFNGNGPYIPSDMYVDWIRQYAL